MFISIGFASILLITSKNIQPAIFIVRHINGAYHLAVGVAYIIAALAAEGESTISQIHFIDRGYEFLEQKLRALGADITRIEE